MLRSHTHAAMLAPAALAAGASAVAAPLIFTNPAPGQPGHADWLEIRFLNITLPASQQAPLPEGAEVRGTFEHFVTESFDPFADPQATITGWFSAGFGGRVSFSNGLLFFQPGALIGPDGAIPNGAGGEVFTDSFNDSTLVGSFLAAALGEHFLGVRYALPGGVNWHYGYIGFNLFERADGTHGLFATQWGYETELDTAITIIPAPGAATALLASGALLAARRRRSA